MSAIINSVLNATIGLLCSKLRDHTASRLKGGDLNDEKCRQIVVRELDDIKSQLDALAKKDVGASLSFFKEGVTRLYGSLETSHEYCDDPNTSPQSVKDQSEVEGATAMLPVTHAEHDVVQKVSDLSKLIGNLNIASQERYKSAKKSFEEAKRLATEAFNNGSLRTEDRIMSSKLRITSRILESLDDPEAAVRDCLLYLKELQDLPEVQAMFSVWKDSDKGITSRVRAFFNQNERNVNVESIQMINALLIDIVMKFANIKMGVLNWPMIKTSKTSNHHPLLHNHSFLRKIEENRLQLPWQWQFPCYLSHFALTGNGDILYSTSTEEDTIIKRRRDECKLFYTIPSEKDGNIESNIRFLTVDQKDNVYIVIEISSVDENVPRRYELLILDAIGNVKAKKFLNIIEEELSYGAQICVTKDGMIVIYCHQQKTMYFCDSINNRPDHKFPMPFRSVDPYNIFQFSITVSNRGEIILFFQSETRPFCFMYFITTDSALKRVVEVDLYALDRQCAVSVAFNHVDETILVSSYPYRDSHRIDSSVTTTIYNLSNAGKLLYRLDIEGDYCALISHLNGSIALFTGNKAITLLKM